VKKIIIWLFILFSCCYLLPQEIKINQKEGIFQDKKESHIAFHKFKKFQPNINKVVISRITKIVIHDDKVFILDGRQSRIFVFDKQANYLYSIGRPGQGPGDLEYPRDFTLSNGGNIYVVNSMAKRLEVFSLKGDFLKRIELELPKEIYYSTPSRILVDQNKNLYIAYNLSSHLIDIYNDQGKYQKSLLKREDEVFIPGGNLGNSSQILFLPKDNSILHFNYFTGVFTKISKTGRVEKVFSVFDAFQSKETSKIKNDMRKSRKKRKSNSLSIKGFQLWSNCCIDKNSNIYVFLLWKKKKEQQKMFVFSPEGYFLYCKTIPYFNKTRVNSLFCFQDLFFFTTPNEEIIFTNKKGG